MRAARSWSIPPLTLWGGDGAWTDKDRLLVQALHLYERGLCPCGCGQPARISQDERYAGLWSKQRTTCYARAELESREKDRKPPPGELMYVEFDLGWERSFPDTSDTSDSGSEG